MMSGDAGDTWENKAEVCFVLGVPGAGKGTQCGLIRQNFGFIHLSAGDLLRKETRPPEGQKMSETGEEIAQYIKEGKIVPVEITVGLLCNAMREYREKENKNKFLVDGFPRNEDNMTGWNRLMSKKANVKFVLFFDCAPEVGVERCIQRGQAGSGRSDDNKESLMKRIQTYKTESFPIIQHYDKLGLVRRISAESSKEEVFSEVRKLFE